MLATIGSINDTLPDEDILAELKRWNESYPQTAITPASYVYREPLKDAVSNYEPPERLRDPKRQ